MFDIENYIHIYIEEISTQDLQEHDESSKGIHTFNLW